MKHALLVGVSDENPQQPLRPGPGLDAIAGLLAELGGWTITRVDGPDADRAGILASLAALERAVGPEDDVLFYFFGHGGAVEIRDVPPPLGGRTVFYLAAGRTDPSWSFAAVLDVELSRALARIDGICGNVSALLDCCHAARIVRGPAWQLHEPPAWVGELAEREALLAPVRTPGIVRLTGSSSLRWAYASRDGRGHIGRLTREFVALVREARLQIDRLSWGSLAQRARERVIEQLGFEDQWITLAGPRDRLLFSRTSAEPARTVAFVPHEHAPGGWIRAGALHGVEVGDEWGLAELTLDERLRPRWIARVRVSAVELNRAVVEPTAELERNPPAGTGAHLLGARRRAAVLVDGPEAARAAVDASSWLRSRDRADDSDSALAVLRSEAGQLELRPLARELATARFTADERGLAAAIELLEDWARARALLELVARRPRSRLTSVEVGWIRDGARANGEAEPRLEVGEGLGVRVRHIGERGQWFVCAVEIGVDGRPVLRNTDEPEGLELRPGDALTLELDRDGVGLRWPAGVPADHPRPVTLLVLASERPIELGHLARTASACELPRGARSRRRARVRGHLSEPRARTGPEPSRAWGWRLLRYHLDPRPATPELDLRR